MKKIPAILLIILMVSCQQQDKPEIAFYYWKTVFKLSETEKSTLLQNKVKKIYLRYFDVVHDKKIKLDYPAGILQFQESVSNFKVVPVIYIQNEVMINDHLDVKDLSSKITHLITQINQRKKISSDEIQIDCDWTINSREQYLSFINEFKKANPTTKLSATIRLHQVKYASETKIPNVEKGVLMYYNMGKIAPDKRNSIYDKNIAKKYLNSLKNYNLPLNVALPIYSWGIKIRNGNVVGLKSKISEYELKKDTNFVRLNDYVFKAKNGNYKHGIYYKKDDLLKLETVSEQDLIEMTDDLKDNLKNWPKEIIIYDLDEFNLNNYEKDIFAKISNRF